jgi:hypothetical protein
MSFLRFLGGAAKKATELEDQYRTRVWKNMDDMWNRYEERKLIEDEEIYSKTKDIKDNVKTLAGLGVNEELMYTGLNQYGEGFFDIMTETLKNIEGTDTWKLSTSEQRGELLNTATQKLIGERSGKPVTLDQIMPALLPRRVSGPAMEDIQGRLGRSPLGFDYSGAFSKSVQDIAGEEDPATAIEGVQGLSGDVRSTFGETFTDRIGVGLSEGDEDRRMDNAIESAIGIGVNKLGDRVVTKRMQDITESEQKELAADLYNEISSLYRKNLSDPRLLNKTENQLLDEAIDQVLKGKNFKLEDIPVPKPGEPAPVPVPVPVPKPGEPDPGTAQKPDTELTEIDNNFIEEVRRLGVPEESITKIIAAIRAGKTISPIYFVGVDRGIARTLLDKYIEEKRQSVAPPSVNDEMNVGA